MAKRHVKKERLTVRLSSQDAGDLEKAARLESTRRGEIVEQSQLLRELAMPRVREIIAGEPVLQS